MYLPDKFKQPTKTPLIPNYNPKSKIAMHDMYIVQ